MYSQHQMYGCGNCCCEGGRCGGNSMRQPLGSEFSSRRPEYQYEEYKCPKLSPLRSKNAVSSVKVPIMKLSNTQVKCTTGSQTRKAKCRASSGNDCCERTTDTNDRSKCCNAKCHSSGLTDTASKRFSNSKNLRKQNYPNSEIFGRGKMDIINEEQEGEISDCDNLLFDNEQSKKIQESCADFLSIVHDTVLETVQKSVDNILREYFVHTMEKIECLCSQMVRNECLLSKIYLDVMEKIADQNDKNMEHFKCMCKQFSEVRDIQEGDKDRGFGSELPNAYYEKD